ncbi:hypothetical protein CR513_52856, partial [Mucuna pruriens]
MLSVMRMEVGIRIQSLKKNSAAPIVNKDPIVRRSSRISQLPLHLRDYELFQDSVANSEGTEVEPVEFEKAVTKEKWLKAMKEEINSIKKNQTWKLVDSLSNKKPITLN